MQFYHSMINVNVSSCSPDKPSAPQNVQVAEQYKDFITISWDEPESDGGAGITGYVVEKRDASRTLWVGIGEVGESHRKFKADHLYEGSEYLFRVAAVNSIGCGPFNQIEESVTAKLPFGKVQLYINHNVNVAPYYVKLK